MFQIKKETDAKPLSFAPIKSELDYVALDNAVYTEMENYLLYTQSGVGYPESTLGNVSHKIQINKCFLKITKKFYRMDAKLQGFALIKSGLDYVALDNAIYTEMKDYQIKDYLS